MTTEAEVHESAGILRMSRAGMSGPMICRVLQISKEQFFHEFQSALDDETDAQRRGVPVYDDRILTCSNCGGAMLKEAPEARLFKCPVCKIVSSLSTKH